MTHDFFTRYSHKKLKKYTHEQMSYTYWFVFVYDRSDEDILRVRELNNKYLNRTITAEEKEEWIAGIKGALNALDLQRIEWNVRLIGDFELLKLHFEVKTWSHGDIPKVNDFVRILDNIQQIRDTGMVMPSTPQVPVQPLTIYQKWNDIEKTMCDVVLIYSRVVGSINYCGEIYAGERNGGL